MPEDNSNAKLGEEKMAYLEDEMVFKIVVLITIVVHKLQSQGEYTLIVIAVNIIIQVKTRCSNFAQRPIGLWFY